MLVWVKKNGDTGVKKRGGFGGLTHGKGQEKEGGFQLGTSAGIDLRGF